MRMQKSILLVAPWTDTYSGWGRYSTGIIKQFEKEKIDHEVFDRSLGRGLKKTVQYYLALRKAAKTVEVVHAFDVWPIGVLSYLSVLGRGKKLYINGVGTYSVPPRKRSLKRVLMVLTLKKAKAIFCISNFVKNKIAERVPGVRLEVVHLAANPLPTLSAREIQAYSEKWNIGKSFPIILTVGAIKDRKGQLDTVKAIRMLKERYKDILYLLVGSREDLDYVKQIESYVAQSSLEPNVRFVSANDDKELSFFYSVADCFVMNSTSSGEHFEGFGLVFLEALQFGKPCVGSRDCGIEDAIKVGETGFLSRQRDTQDIAKKIESALAINNQELEENASLFLKEFSWANTVKAYISAYRR